MRKFAPYVIVHGLATDFRGNVTPGTSAYLTPSANCFHRPKSNLLMKILSHIGVQYIVEKRLF